MGDIYRPSNGSEGESFHAQFCDRCSRDKFDGDGGESCPILLRAIAHGVDHPDYPAEWTYDSAGRPTCTAFLGDEPEQYRCTDTRDIFG